MDLDNARGLCVRGDGGGAKGEIVTVIEEKFFFVKRGGGQKYHILGNIYPCTIFYSTGTIPKEEERILCVCLPTVVQ